MDTFDVIVLHMWTNNWDKTSRENLLNWKLHVNPGVWYIFVILALGELRQGDYEIQSQPVRAVSTLLHQITCIWKIISTKVLIYTPNRLTVMEFS